MPLQKNTPQYKHSIKELLHIEAQLDTHIPSTLWISDLHGEGDRFISILRGRFGMLYQTVREALPKNFSSEKLLYLSNIIRRQTYYCEDSFAMDTQEVIQSLIDILHYKLHNKIYTWNDLSLPKHFQPILTNLLQGKNIPHIIYENEHLAVELITAISRIIMQTLLDHIVILGDIFDRGAHPDKIVRILSSKPISEKMSLILGNHDILWMGAAAGNTSLIAETLRITCRYDHLDIFKRLGFNIKKLAEFAVDTYPQEKISPKFKAKNLVNRAMEKALFIIQMKLEEQTIQKHPQFNMSSRLWLDKLIALLENDAQENLTDTHFSTIDKNNPHQLTPDEQSIIYDLTEQFRTNKKLKRMMRIFFEKGKVYHCYNNILNIHALIPSDENANFQELLGYKGKALLDYIQQKIRIIGEKYLTEKPQDNEDLALMFYLWCGPVSPFFGKNAMKTFERYFLIDKTLHKETTLYWEDNLHTAKFQTSIKKEFQIERVVYGHTPRDYLKGQKIASADGFAINIDGGFAEAYYHRGHALIHTPLQIYGVVLSSDDELKEYNTKKYLAPDTIEPIVQFNYPKKYKNTPMAKKLYKKKEHILNNLFNNPHDTRTDH